MITRREDFCKYSIITLLLICALHKKYIASLSKNGIIKSGMPSDKIEQLSKISNEIVEEVEIDLPPDYNVIMYNDDYTTKEFVVDVLESVFHKSFADSVKIMEQVHQTGSAVVGTYTYDIAKTRVAITIRRARSAGFPLRCEMESA